MKMQESLLSLYLEEIHNFKQNEGSFMEFLYIGYEEFPCKEKSTVGSSQNEGSAEGRWDIRSTTWITVCTLDVSKSEANSL